MLSTERSSGEILALTGLRGVAALYVLLFHAFRQSSPLAGFVLGKGYLSVDVFFVLSGFVMALTYGRWFAAGPVKASSYVRFLGVRLARIYPLYIVMTLLCAMLGLAALVPLYGVPSLPIGLLWNSVLLQSLSFGAGNLDAVAWSLSTEWVAYLAFPVFAWWVLGGSLRRAWFAFGLAVVVLTGIALSSLSSIPGLRGDGPLGVFDTLTPMPVLRCFAGFVLGMVAYRAMDGSVARALASRPVYGDLLALALGGLLFVHAGDVLFVILATAFILHLAVSSSFASKVLSLPGVHYLGQVSYSIYLIHFPLILLLRSLSEQIGFHHLIVANSLAVVLTLIVAPLTYHAIELPGRNLVRSLIEPRRAHVPAG